MAVRTSLRPAGGGPEAVMFWFFDRMETLQRHVARGGGASLLQKIETGAARWRWWWGLPENLRGQLRLSCVPPPALPPLLVLPCPNSPLLATPAPPSLAATPADQRHVERATRKDTQYIQNVLLDWQRWKSPADDFIHVASPPPGASRSSRQRRRPAPSPGSGSPRTLSPMSLSKSPSNDSLAALPAGTSWGQAAHLPARLLLAC